MSTQNIGMGNDKTHFNMRVNSDCVDYDSETYKKVKELIGNGQLKEALETATTIKAPAINSYAIQCVAMKYLANGNLKETRHAANKISDPFHQGLVLEQLSDKFLEKDKVKKIEKIASTIQCPFIRARVYGSLSQKYTELGKTTEALNARRKFNKARKTYIRYESHSFGW